jgi:hypothetical protein
MMMLSDAEAYTQHVAKYHSVDGVRVQVKPENTTGRTKAEIVQAVESKLRQFIIGPEETVRPAKVLPSHEPDCRCVDCFNKKLDALILSSGRALEELQNGTLNANVSD